MVLLEYHLPVYSFLPSSLTSLWTDKVNFILLILITTHKFIIKMENTLVVSSFDIRQQVLDNISTANLDI